MKLPPPKPKKQLFYYFSSFCGSKILQGSAGKSFLMWHDLGSLDGVQVMAGLICRTSWWEFWRLGSARFLSLSSWNLKSFLSYLSCRVVKLLTWQLKDPRDQGIIWQSSSRLGLELVQLYFHRIPLVKALTDQSRFQGRGITRCLGGRNVTECAAIFISLHRMNSMAKVVLDS